MRIRPTFCVALLVMAFVVAATTGCKRRPQEYAGIEAPQAQATIDPYTQNQ